MEKTYFINNYDICIANIINFIHICLIVFILSAPFTKSKYIVSINIFLILFILNGWFMSYNNPEIDNLDGFHFGRCKLTELECKLRGIEYKNGFIFRVIKPFSTINESKLNCYIRRVTILWLLVDINKKLNM